MEHYDLIIVGGGLVGSGLALALADAGMKVALLDARLPNGNDPRLFALNDNSCTFLKNLQLWPELTQFACPISEVHVSYKKHFGSVRLQREDLQLPSLGWVIPACYIEQALYQKLQKASHLTLYQPGKLIALAQRDHLATLTIDMSDGIKELTTAMVIGADGTDSMVRTQLNMATTVFDYEQSAIVTKTALTRSHQHIAYERFTDNGAIAMLPMVDRLGQYECATIWTLPNKEAEALFAQSDDAFLAYLQRQFGYRLGKLRSIGARHIFPLRFVNSDERALGCVLLLGNALHTLHPVAAQGFNLAIYEVAMLVEGILTRVEQGQPVTVNELIKIYDQTHRQRELSVAVSHRLAKIVGSHSFWNDMVIPFGMVSLDILPPLKKYFMSKMMGRTGRIPRLLLSAH